MNIFKVKSSADPHKSATPSEAARLKELVKNPHAPFEDRADLLIPHATNDIYNFIKEDMGRDKDTHVNRASSANYCVKRRWMQRTGVEAATPITPRKVVNFLLGNLAEKALLYLIGKACVGEGKLYSEVNLGRVIGSDTFQGKEFLHYEQEDIVANIPGLTDPITAHADGWGKRNSDGRWELIEIKSSSNYGFKEFQDDGPGDYLKQAHALMLTSKAKELGVAHVRFFYLRKETGHLYDRMYEWNAAIEAAVIEGFVVSNQKEEPAIPFPLYERKVDGKHIAKFPCTYCPYLRPCQGPHHIEWNMDKKQGIMKPTYVF